MASIIILLCGDWLRRFSVESDGPNPSWFSSRRSPPASGSASWAGFPVELVIDSVLGPVTLVDVVTAVVVIVFLAVLLVLVVGTNGHSNTSPLPTARELRTGSEASLASELCRPPGVVLATSAQSMKLPDVAEGVELEPDEPAELGVIWPDWSTGSGSVNSFVMRIVGVLSADETDEEPDEFVEVRVGRVVDDDDDNKIPPDDDEPMVAPPVVPLMAIPLESRSGDRG